MIRGSFVALVTPFDEKGRIQYDRLKELLVYHMANQTDGIVLLGTTAEASTLSIEEQEDVLKFSLKIIDGRLPVIVGAGSNDTALAIEKAKRFSKLGADYLLCITPYYNKTNPTGLKKHFLAIADASSCPIILYNVPSRTGMSIPIEVLQDLAKHKNIVGIKEASGDISYASKISLLLSDSFFMLSGNDDIIVPMMSIGAVGVISVLANICPSNTHRLCTLCLEQKYEEARKLQGSLLPIAQALFLETNPIPIKEAMNQMGMVVGGYRMPLDGMDFALKEKLIMTLKDNEEWLK